jgi:hypothetical protein
MNRFEQALTEALRPRKPSGVFAARVLESVAQRTGGEPPSRPWLTTPWLRWSVAAVLCVALLAAILIYARERQQRRAQGEAARRQVIVALRIAGTKMRLARAKVQLLSEK